MKTFRFKYTKSTEMGGSIIINMYKAVVRDGRQAQHHDKRMEAFQAGTGISLVNEPTHEVTDSLWVGSKNA